MSPTLPSVPLRAYTEKYLADGSKPVGTAVSDLFALGRSVDDLLNADRIDGYAKASSESMYYWFALRHCQCIVDTVVSYMPL
jgi:hypothetical protein